LALRLPQELLERIDRYAARLEGELHLSVSRSDALRRLLTLALEDAEGTAKPKQFCGLMNRVCVGRGSKAALPRQVPTAAWIRCCSDGWTVSELNRLSETPSRPGVIRLQSDADF
jgi:hypothetical protein